ncbi:MAG: histidine kinase [Gemmatimonadaceae bacterium]|nr:histidine kinase [Chitinophagaceae bacterium]
MFFKEKQLRIYGFLSVVFIFYFFFMLEMFFSWRDENMWLKTISITLLFALAIWEVPRYFIKRIRERFQGTSLAKLRVRYTLLFVIPYAFLIGFLRINIEHTSNLWGVPIATFTTYSYSIGISLLFVLLQLAVYESLYFFEEWNKSREETEELRRTNYQIQFDSLKVQIQPHFLFNALNTLIGLMKVDTPRAIRFTEEMARVYRYLLEANNSQMISLAEEMDFTRAYFFLLKTRYCEGLHLEAEGLTTMNDFSLPPLSLQLLIENAVKHNIITRERPLHIRMNFEPAMGKLTITNNMQQKKGLYNTGHGLMHLKKKFELLHMGDVNIFSSGEIFSVTLPLKRIAS